MMISQLITRFLHSVRKYGAETSGTVAIVFGLSAVPLAGLVGVAIDYGRAAEVQTALQGAIDVAAMATAKAYSANSAMSNAQLSSYAQNFVNGTFTNADSSAVTVTATPSAAATGAVQVVGSASVPTSFMQLLGYTALSVGAKSAAGYAAQVYPMCVIVTASTQLHTLFALGNSSINFNNCMVQVNTTDWDAVETRDSAYINNVGGENCFVGQIHMGTVNPAKDPSCTFYADPFANYPMPATAPASYCTTATTNLSINTSQTLQPGTYCGGLAITGGNVTMAPGTYIIQSGNLWITGSANVDATQGVTIVLTGTGPNLYVDGNATFNIVAPTSGQFAGFVVYLDSKSTSTCSSISDGNKVPSSVTPESPPSTVTPPAAGGKKAPPSSTTTAATASSAAANAVSSTSNQCVNFVTGNATMTMNGIYYTAGEALLVDGSSIFLGTGSVISTFLVANGNGCVSIAGFGYSPGSTCVNTAGVYPPSPKTNINVDSTAPALQLVKASQGGTGTLSLLQ